MLLAEANLKSIEDCDLPNYRKISVSHLAVSRLHKNLQTFGLLLSLFIYQFYPPNHILVFGGEITLMCCTCLLVAHNFPVSSQT